MDSWCETRTRCNVLKVNVAMLFCFSFKCGIDYHAPTDCDTIKKWLTKCADDSETANYISAHTKDVSTRLKFARVFNFLASVGNSDFSLFEIVRQTAGFYGAVFAMSRASTSADGTVNLIQCHWLFMVINPFPVRPENTRPFYIVLQISER